MAVSDPTFHAADYVVFAGLLVISLGIGIFFAIKTALSKKSNNEGFLLAGRSMGVFPVALSLTVGFMSAVLILGTPADTYMHGTMFWWGVLGFFISCVVSSEIFIPTYRKLNIASSYEYLELRFGRALRMMTTTLYIVQTVMYIGVVIYGPALAINVVTGFNLWGAVIATGTVCVIYCVLGGLKAAIWIDVFLACVMISGVLAVIFRGIVVMGGFGNIWSLCEEGGRIDLLNFSTDPRVRHSWWSMVVGGSFIGLAMYGINPAAVQRYLSCKTDKKAKRAVMLNWVGLFLANTLAVVCGLVAYAYYKDCDPLRLKQIKAPDQLMPYLAMDILSELPGFAGLFLACVYAGSLSTISAGINGMTCVTVSDYIKPFTSFKDQTYTYISKALIFIIGSVCMVMSYVTSLIGKLILQIAISLTGIIGGPTLGVFTMGMIMPWCNAKGAIVGFASGIAMTMWIFIGSLIYPPPVEFRNNLPLSTSKCLVTTSPALNTTLSTAQYITQNTTIDVDFYTTSTLATSTTAASPVNDRPAIADMYAISYFYYAAIGFATTLLIGVIVSIATGGHKVMHNVRSTLICPIFDHWIFGWLPKDVRITLRFGISHDEEKEEPHHHHECKDKRLSENEHRKLSSETADLLKMDHLKSSLA